MSWKFLRAKRDPAWDEILDRIKAYNNEDHKSMVHVRIHEHTVLLLNQLKLATGIDITKIAAFAISELIRQHPELRTIVKQFLNKINQ
jgi:hypothetical protein